MSINLVLNLDRVSVLQAVSRLCEMNNMLLYLPSLKHQEGSPEIIPKVQKFNSFELCTIILGAVPQKAQRMYYALHPEEFTCDVDQLRKQLEKIRDDHAAEKERFNQLLKIAGLAQKARVTCAATNSPLFSQ